MWDFIIYLIRRFFGLCAGDVQVATSSVSVTEQTTYGDNAMTNNRYALLVGINKYTSMQGADLNGCVNDVNDMYYRLTKHYGFPEDNIRVLCDARATQQNILERLEWLVSSAKPGDQLVFHYSGHGSSIRCRVDDKLEDEECQILCPTDMDWDNPLTDKMLAQFFKRIPAGAFLTFICDSCHSGTMDRGAFPIGNPHETKIRFMPPPFDISVRSRSVLPVNRVGWKDLNGPKNGNIAFFDTRHLLLSGCRDNQTSADAFIGGQYNGAMTAALKKALDSNLDADWFTVHTEMLKYLTSEKFTQVPQLSGPEKVLKQSVFRGL